MRSGGMTLITAVLACASVAASAANQTVLVGGYTAGSGGGYYGGGKSDTPILGFSPANLTINAGDSVTFVNQPTGDLIVAHNVAADGLFRCANGCDGDGQGGNGDPASNQWSATVTFTSPGMVHYYCEVHRGMGMVGTITVDAVATAQNITGGISGNWFDPDPNQAGHGFQIEVLPDSGMLAIWFVFDPAGTAQNWIYAQGTYDANSNTATLPAFLEQGGAFPPNFNSNNVTAPAWGTLQFTFSGCNDGTVAWKSNATSAAAGYADTTFPIQRVTSLAGTSCP